jgi:two-component system, OmpR family, phosphate regulon sensor histidine kinase PhoR
MNNRHLRRVILLGTVVLTGLLILQVYWFKKAFDVQEKQFDHSVQVALRKVADSVSRNSEVKKLSSNFFFVATQSELNDKNLDSLLKQELSIRNLDVDYELGVYNADDDTLVYGNYVYGTTPAILRNGLSGSSEDRNEKNFAVYFLKKESYIAAQLDVWIFSVCVLLLMMGFFAYAIYSLLKERKFASLKSDFINNMTHEFKTPVTNIKIAGEILSTKISGQDGMKVYVDILLKENEKLREKIDQVLVGSSAEHMKRPVLDVVDVHQLITDCADAFQFKVRERKGTIQLQFHAGNTCVLGDRELLSQAIINVIDNAEKYSPKHPLIKVVTKDEEKGIAIDIIDEGIGIPSNMKSKVFEKFFRVRSGDVHTVKGFGLGLSFVKSVIRSHRGKISLFSELNRGTQVRIILPKA